MKIIEYIPHGRTHIEYKQLWDGGPYVIHWTTFALMPRAMGNQRTKRRDDGVDQFVL